MTNPRLVEDLLITLNRKLPFEVPNLKSRFRVWSEKDKYRWKEDESVWKQVRGLSYEQYEVYFDGEFVCFFDLGMTMDQTVLEVMKGLIPLFKSGKVFINESMYEVRALKAAEDRKKAHEIEIAAPTTPEEKILAEVLTRVAKKRNKKVVTKKAAHAIN